MFYTYVKKFKPAHFAAELSKLSYFCVKVAPLGQAEAEVEVVAVVEAKVEFHEELVVEQPVQYVLLPHHL